MSKSTDVVAYQTDWHGRIVVFSLQEGDGGLKNVFFSLARRDRYIIGSTSWRAVDCLLTPSMVIAAGMSVGFRICQDGEQIGEGCMQGLPEGKRLLSIELRGSTAEFVLSAKYWADVDALFLRCARQIDPEAV
jgi:hypothetical protein